MTRCRLRLVVRGVVQGVGFRPFVSHLAKTLSLSGFVRNQIAGVLIEIEGEEAAARRFVATLAKSPPVLARIEGIDSSVIALEADEGFRIEESSGGSGASSSSFGAPIITPDVATCDACVAELFDRSNRRAHHPFITCTDCGPRLSIIEGMPYDRERTTMRGFPMCEACRSEYEDPSDRRFHAQPIACSSCGPRLAAPMSSIEDTAALLRDGRLIAVKGIGGYHLACLATNESAVARLRQAKHRDAKPFAILVADLEVASTLCIVSSEERALLMDGARPIVLLERRRPSSSSSSSSSSATIAPSVAPGQSRLGVMLPYSPIHHLLIRAVNAPLVMTSGNVTDEPIAFEDDDAALRLGPLVDGAILRHDRPIHHRLEDSIAHVIDGAPSILRRSRGYAPLPLPLPLMKLGMSPTLALGGQLKAVFALGVGDRAYLSQHFGDLDAFEAWRSYREGIDRYCDLLRVSPTRIVHDLHPDYATTALAIELERSHGLERIGVQHHEAHVASCVAENRSIAADENVLGVAFDGLGYGHDGAMWGGEIFSGSLRSGFARRAHLRYVALPGGDRAAREPWRMAIAWLSEAKIDPKGRIAATMDGDAVSSIEKTLPSSIRTSSAGRLFDAVSSILGIRSTNTYEAEAAMALQARAEQSSAINDDASYPFDLSSGGDCLELDPRPLIAAIVREVDRIEDVGVIAHRFHVTLAEMITAGCRRLGRDDGRQNRVVLTGGVFANALLVMLTAKRLRAAGFEVCLHRHVPTTDGGLALGQLALAGRI